MEQTPLHLKKKKKSIKRKRKLLPRWCHCDFDLPNQVPFKNNMLDNNTPDSDPTRRQQSSITSNKQMEKTVTFLKGAVKLFLLSLSLLFSSLLFLSFLVDLSSDFHDFFSVFFWREGEREREKEAAVAQRG